MQTIRFRLAVAVARLLNDESGQGTTEYGLVLVLVAVVAIAALSLTGTSLTKELSTIANSV